MNKKIVIFITGVFIFFAGVSADAGQLTLRLEDALRIAVSDNRQLAVAQARQDQAQAGVSLARSAVMPNFDLSGDWGLTRGLYSKDIAQVSAKAGLKQDLYLGGKITAGVRKSEFDLLAAQASLSKEKQDVLLKVKKTFYTVLLADRYYRINRLLAVNAKRHLSYIEDLYAQGQASESELLDKKAVFSEALYFYRNAGIQRESAAELLANLLYLKKDSVINVSGVLDYDLRDAAYDTAFLKAVAARPELKLYEARERSAIEAVKIARAGGRPALSAVWDYYSSNRALSSPVKNANDYNVAGLVVSWPLFDGGEAKAKVEGAIAEVKAARALREQTLKDIGTDLKQACLGLQEALEALKASEEDLRVYKYNFRVALEKYRGGIVSFLDLQDAALKYETACFNKEEAVFAYMLSGIDFDKAIGGV